MIPMEIDIHNGMKLDNDENVLMQKVDMNDQIYARNVLGVVTFISHRNINLSDDIIHDKLLAFM